MSYKSYVYSYSIHECMNGIHAWVQMKTVENNVGVAIHHESTLLA